MHLGHVLTCNLMDNVSCSHDFCKQANGISFIYHMISPHKKRNNSCRQYILLQDELSQYAISAVWDPPPHHNDRRMGYTIHHCISTDSWYMLQKSSYAVHISKSSFSLERRDIYNTHSLEYLQQFSSSLPSVQSGTSPSQG